MTIKLRSATRGPGLAPDFHSCDRCGVRARVHANLASSGELYFCSHHAREFRQALTEAGARLDIIPL